MQQKKYWLAGIAASGDWTCCEQRTGRFGDYRSDVVLGHRGNRRLV